MLRDHVLICLDILSRFDRFFQASSFWLGFLCFFLIGSLFTLCPEGRLFQASLIHLVHSLLGYDSPARQRDYQPVKGTTSQAKGFTLSLVR